jgi:hypothetical protein
MPLLDRSAFLYLSPRGDKDLFAQCITCRDWVGGDAKCYIHGPNVDVPWTASCGLYVNGEPLPAGSETYAIVTPIESGLVDREVRCENCKWFDYVEDSICGLFDLLNDALPDVFDLDIHVEEKGCCNAQQPPETDG